MRSDMVSRRRGGLKPIIAGTNFVWQWQKWLYLCNSSGTSSSSSRNSSSSDTKIANAAPAERSLDDSADEDSIVSQGFNWQCAKNYSGVGQVLCGECGPRNGAENIRDFVDCFGLYFWQQHHATHCDGLLNQKFHGILKETTERRNCPLLLLFNVVKTDLFWRWIASHTFISY